MSNEAATTEHPAEECEHLWMTEYAIHFCFHCGAKR